MGCEAGRCKTSTPYGIFIVTPSLEGWPTKAKEAPSPHEVRLTPLDTNPVFYRKYSTMVRGHSLTFHTFVCQHSHCLYGSTCHIDHPELSHNHF